MPPRKRARLTPSASTKTSPEAEASTPTPSSPAPRSSRSGHRRAAIPRASPDRDSTPASQSASPTPSSPWAVDPWTAAQETALFKALIRHKPVGIHKHFHMLSISSYLALHANPRESRDRLKSLDDLPPHTRIPAIWDKLDTLYDLPALDERQDAYGFPSDPDAPFEDFHLPGDPASHGPNSDANDNSGEVDSDHTFFASQIWARRFPNPEIEADMDSSPEPDLLPLRRGPDGAVESVAPAPSVRSTRKAAPHPPPSVAATPVSAPASTARRSHRRDANIRASGTPLTDAAADDKDEAANETKVEPSEEDEEGEEAEEEEEEEEEEVENGEDEEDGAEEGDGAEEEGEEEEEEEEEEDDDEDELGDSTSRPAARSTRSSARVRRR